MVNWRNYRLDQFADVLDSFRVPVNEEERAKNPGETPYYGANGLQGYISGWLFDEPLILIAEDGGYFDEYSTRPVAYKIEGKSWVNNHAHILRPKEEFDFNFVFYSLQHKNITPFIKGGTRAKLNQKELREIVIFSPVEKRHQQKIVHFLQTIDRAIEHTEALIDKYQQIKAGLMHDLFTRGIGPNGQLRPPRDQTPELYQQTPIGWIPKEWEVKSCSDLCSRICVGIVIQPTQYYVEAGIPAFRSANVRESGIDPTKMVYISLVSNQLLSKSQVKAGDIISVRTGYPGTSAVVPDEFEGANCVDILISTPTEHVLPEFLCSWINSSFGKGQVLRQQGGMAQQHFNVGEMRQLLVVVPVIAEQTKISTRLQSCSDRVQAEEKILQKLNKQKSGLMHDLLTGKVPVTVDAATSEAAHG